MDRKTLEKAIELRSEWKPILDLEPEEGRDIHLDTRDFKCRQVVLENRVKSDDADCLIGKDEMRPFISRVRESNGPDDMLWWRRSDLKYIWFVSQGDSWVVADRNMNPIRWREI